MSAVSLCVSFRGRSKKSTDNEDIICYKNTPKPYEYLGLIILFYSQEHESIHAHCKSQGRESKVELISENGNFVEVKITNVSEKNH
ncbi:MAG: DUF4160 domain-containing protein [Alphaproteobacteria bacterium]